MRSTSTTAVVQLHPQRQQTIMAQPQPTPPQTPPAPQTDQGPNTIKTTHPVATAAAASAVTKESSLGAQGERLSSQHDMDLNTMGENGKLSSSPPGSYTRVPPRSIDPSAVPPILPPHLLQVILNDPDKANATILPQPNHVMLNHLYALSIKDGIMVLSATHRFRKKYVTTLLYKPI